MRALSVRLSKGELTFSIGTSPPSGPTNEPFADVDMIVCFFGLCSVPEGRNYPFSSASQHYFNFPTILESPPILRLVHVARLRPSTSRDSSRCLMREALGQSTLFPFLPDDLTLTSRPTGPLSPSPPRHDPLSQPTSERSSTLDKPDHLHAALAGVMSIHRDVALPSSPLREGATNLFAPSSTPFSLAFDSRTELSGPPTSVASS